MKKFALSTLFLSIASGLKAAISQPQVMRAIDIPAGPLPQSLRQFVMQTGVQVLYQDDAIANIEAPTVAGAIAPSDALNSLLGSSGLSYEFVNEHTIAVGKEKPPSRGTQSVQSLAEIPTNELESVAALACVPVPEVLVRGTRSLNLDIKRSQDDVRPYVILECRNIERSDVTTLEELISQKLTAGHDAALENRSILSGGTIKLFPSGKSRPLILINGRRPFASGRNGYCPPDLSNIPRALIERIEILPAPASGIYGGGATGGVVNFVLRDQINESGKVPSTHPATCAPASYRVFTGLVERSAPASWYQLRTQHELCSLISSIGVDGKAWASDVFEILKLVDAFRERARVVFHRWFRSFSRCSVRKITSSRSAYRRLPILSTPSLRLLI